MIAALFIAAGLGPALPDPALTPGSVSTTDVAVVCRAGFARTQRPPYDFAWRQLRIRVFSSYGIPHELWRSYTEDHLVPLELGGAGADPKNLWPQPRREAQLKDRVEDALHRAVCITRQLPLARAQREIMHDWRATSVGTPEMLPPAFSEQGEH